MHWPVPDQLDLPSFYKLLGSLPRRETLGPGLCMDLSVSFQVTIPRALGQYKTQLSYMLCFWCVKESLGQTKGFKLKVPTACSMEQLSFRIRFSPSKIPRILVWSRPFCPAFCCSPWLPLLMSCHSWLSRMLPNQLLGSAAPTRPCSVLASPKPLIPLQLNPLALLSDHLLF